MVFLLNILIWLVQKKEKAEERKAINYFLSVPFIFTAWLFGSVTSELE